MKRPLALRLAPLALLAAWPAAAHVTLHPAEAPAGAYQRLSFQVGHGCAGAATTAIEVTLPEGVTTARPMPKPGWNLAIETRRIERPMVGAPGPVREAPASISWRGGPLADAHYEEFVMLIRTPDQPGETLAFPVIQRCEQGRQNAWTELADAANPRPRQPATLLRLAPR